MNARGFYGRYLLARAAFLAVDLTLLLPLTVLAAVSRAVRRPVAVGLGPTPIINAVYHKQALVAAGWSAETFVDSVWHLTSDFDFRADLLLPGRALSLFRPYFLFVRALFRYRAIYTYFSGGCLRTTTLLCHLEAPLLRLAGIKTIILAFGSDVQDLTRTGNLLFVDAMGESYPQHRFLRGHIGRCIDTWTRWADHIVAGCDWVEYLYYWDTLLISHFAIDTDAWRPAEQPPRAAGAPLRVLHAPNHRAIKGTGVVIRAVDELRAEGVGIELTLVEGLPNSKMQDAIAAADLVVDQLVIGWYAMFSIEAMAMGKPVICHQRGDLLRLFRAKHLIEDGEPPLIDADTLSVKDVLRDLAKDRDRLEDWGRRGRDYVTRHHSLARIGAEFDRINAAIGLARD